MFSLFIFSDLDHITCSEALIPHQLINSCLLLTEATWCKHHVETRDQLPADTAHAQPRSLQRDLR